MRDASNKKRTRKQHFQKTLINDSTQIEKNAFKQFQNFFDRSIFFVHYDKFRRFFINVDAFKKKNYDVIVYHVKINVHSFNLTISPRRQNIESIMFLNKILSSIEKRY